MRRQAAALHKPRLAYRADSSSKLVADLSQETATDLHVFGGFDSLGRAAVDHTEDGAALLGLGQDHFDRVGRGAEDVADLEAVADAAEQVDRVGLADQQDEAVESAEPGSR